MSVGLKPYPEMKDSGVLWLGKVPAHWELPRLGVLLRERGEQNDDGRISEVLSVVRNRGVIPYSEKGNVGNKRSEDITRYKVVRPDDIVVNSMNVIIGSVGLSRYTGCLSPVYYVLTKRSMNDHPQYLGAYFQTEPFQKSLVRIGNGILAHRMRIPMEILKCEPFPRPPPGEQATIVRFLDYANQRIRAYLRQKQKLIALLEEQKQVTIHQAVTGQIDVQTGKRYSAYKDSGVGWLSAVPRHWDVLRLGKVIDLTVGFPFKSEGFTQSEEDIRLLRGINVAPGHLRWDEVVRWPATDVAKYAEFQLSIGDIILGMDRPIVGGGVRVAVVNEPDVPSLLLQRVARIRPIKRKLTHEFAVRLLSGISFSDYLAPIFTGISVPHLSPEQIRGFQVALPSFAEQEAIGSYLKSITERITHAVNRARTQVSVMHEFRTRLIADAVTGKFDTRHAALLPQTEGDDIEDWPDDGRRTYGRPILDGLGSTLVDAEA